MKFLQTFFFQRPRILNVLHKFHFIEATSQTNEKELEVLSKYASGAEMAIEIGSYQGVSAARIAQMLAPSGRLYCVDPWPEDDGRPNPNLRIFERHLRRTRLSDRIEVVRGFSGLVGDRLPQRVDFAFIDGDHSWEGIETDWKLISPRIKAGGCVCLHDTAVPSDEPWRQPPSVRFFDERIAADPDFSLLETVDSMQVVKKNAAISV